MINILILNNFASTKGIRNFTRVLSRNPIRKLWLVRIFIGTQIRWAFCWASFFVDKQADKATALRQHGKFPISHRQQLVAFTPCAWCECTLIKSETKQRVKWIRWALAERLRECLKWFIGQNKIDADKWSALSTSTICNHRLSLECEKWRFGPLL